MRNFLICLAGASVALSAAPAIAHPEEESGSRYQRAPSTTELAGEAVAKLVAQSKLAASWTNARAVTTTTRTRKGAEQYVVTFRNDAIRQPAKRMLYVVMTSDGRFVSANHKLI